jgi:hypothetical protein
MLQAGLGCCKHTAAAIGLLALLLSMCGKPGLLQRLMRKL